MKFPEMQIKTNHISLYACHTVALTLAMLPEGGGECQNNPQDIQWCLRNSCDGCPSSTASDFE